MNFSTLCTVITPIFSALVIWYIEHHHIESDKRQEELRNEERKRQDEKARQAELRVIERAIARKTESLLTMQMIQAIGKLSYANAIALKEGRINGVMEDALQYYSKKNNEMTKFLQEQAVEHYFGEEGGDGNGTNSC